MKIHLYGPGALAALAVMLATGATSARTIDVAPGADAHERLQGALIDAKSGDVVRIAAGRYDLSDGLTLDTANVTIAGELEGNVEEALRIDLLQTGVVIGDLRAGSLTVVAGARMRGQAEFGWDDGEGSKAGKHTNGYGAESGAGS